MPAYRYSAFLSYSHADHAVAAWLHRALEGYRVPAKLVDTITPLGLAPRRLPPVFRDREELPASGDLGAELTAALEAARFLIVLCSPAAARSRWVAEEVRSFKARRGPGRVLALIVEGEPGDPERECFPDALRFQLDRDGQLTDIAAEPIAADLRAGGDGRRLALMKLVAGLTGLPLDALARRDAARRQRRLAWLASGASGVAVLTAGLAVYANGQRIEAVAQRRVAEREKRTAEASLDFLIGTYQIANPATENPRTISAVTILGRVSERVRTELLGQPRVSARLLRATGDIYNNLGLPRESERDLRASLALLPRRAGPDAERAATMLRLATVLIKAQRIKDAEPVIDAAAGIAPATGPEAATLAARLAEGRSLVAYLRGKPRDAVALADRAVALYAAAPGDHLIDRARVLSNGGQMLVAAKDFVRADAALAEAVSLYTQRYGPRHVTTATAVKNRAFGAFEAGRLAEAERLSATAIAVYERVLEPNHPVLIDASTLQGRILLAEGQIDAARKAFSRAGLISAKLFGPMAAEHADVLFYGAQAESDARNFGVALSQVDQAQRAYRQDYGANHPDEAALSLIEAQIARAAGLPGQARMACAAAMRILTALDDPGVADARAQCAALLADPPTKSLRFEGVLGSS